MRPRVSVRSTAISSRSFIVSVGRSSDVTPYAANASAYCPHPRRSSHRVTTASCFAMAPSTPDSDVPAAAVVALRSPSPPPTSLLALESPSLDWFPSLGAFPRVYTPTAPSGRSGITRRKGIFAFAKDATTEPERTRPRTSRSGSPTAPSGESNHASRAIRARSTARHPRGTAPNAQRRHAPTLRPSDGKSQVSRHRIPTGRRRPAFDALPS